jgi:hypothetical protein
MKILLLTMQKGDATSFYRAAGVVSDIESQTGHDVTIQDWSEQTLAWPVLINYDLVWMQRPIQPEAVNTVQYLKLIGKPVWVEYDDDLFNLPQSHQYYAAFGKARNNIIQILQLADAVTVTTPTIAESYEPYSKNITIVPNAIRDELLAPVELPWGDEFMYRGMKAHEDDLYAYRQPFQILLNEGMKIKFMTGFNPVRYFTGKMTVVENRDIYHYFDYIRKFRARSFLFPMVDNRFNQARSNICWLEATMAGSVVVAPDWGEWSHPGIIRYRKPEEFHEVVLEIMRGQVSVDQAYHESYRYIRENLLLSKVNKLRIEIINKLTN